MTLQLNPTGSDPYETKTLADIRARVFAALGFITLAGMTNAPLTLGALRSEIFNMLGMAAMTAFRPPGVDAMLSAFINGAQQTVFRRLEMAGLAIGQTPVLAGDQDPLTIDPTLVRQLALGQAKAHYGQEDGKLYLEQAEKYLSDIINRIPPNATALVSRIISDAQMELYRRYRVFHVERWYSWTLQAGQRFYPIQGNDERAPLATPTGVTVAAGDPGTYGSMNFGRQEAASVLLNDGRILVVGGYDGLATNYASCEIYDPSTGLFANTGSMGYARRSPAATVLPNGLVLVTGGFNSVPLDSAELYNPASGAFTPLPAMTSPRAAHTSTLLPSGKVLLTGGSNNDGTHRNSAELFDFNTGAFTALPVMAHARGFHTATLLPSGRVLIAGGISAGITVNNTAELFDPITSTFSNTGNLTTPVEGHTATLLANGNVAIIGGIISPFGIATSAHAQIYTTATGVFANSAGDLATSRGNHVATLLPNGKVLVSGGVNSLGFLSSSEIFDAAAGTFAAGPALSVARTSATAVWSPFTVKFYVIGSLPTTGTEAFASVEIYSYAGGTFATSGIHTSGSRSYRVSFATALGKHTLASAEVSAVIPGDTTARIGWDLPTNPAAVYALIYGRAAGSEKLIAQVDATLGFYLDTGTIIPNGALPTSNTTGGIGPIVDQREITYVGVSRGDTDWHELREGVVPEYYNNQTNGIPSQYEIREEIELWPPPTDSQWLLRIKGYFVLGQFETDNDLTTLDWQAVYLQAAADAKVTFKQPDAQLWQNKIAAYIGELIAKGHGTHRYLPGRAQKYDAVRPILLDSDGNVVT